MARSGQRLGFNLPQISAANTVKVPRPREDPRPAADLFSQLQDEVHCRGLNDHMARLEVSIATGFTNSVIVFAAMNLVDESAEKTGRGPVIISRLQHHPPKYSWTT